MPPWPISARMAYGPRVELEARGMGEGRIIASRAGRGWGRRDMNASGPWEKRETADAAAADSAARVSPCVLKHPSGPRSSRVCVRDTGPQMTTIDPRVKKADPGFPRSALMRVCPPRVQIYASVNVR